MAALTRDEMHIKMDLGLNILNSNRLGKLAPEAKDLILNGIIDTYVNDIIRKLDSANQSQRVPGGIILYDDVIAKYNDLRTLIKDSIIIPTIVASNYEINLATSIPTLFKFETAIANAVITSCNKIRNIPIAFPDQYSLGSYNIHPYGASRKYPSGTIRDNKLIVSVNPKYTVGTITIIYIKTPAKLASGTNCDLPPELHTEVVERAIKYIAATSDNSNYQNISIESRKPQQ